MFFSASRQPSDHGIATGSSLLLLQVDNTRLLMLGLGLFLMNSIAQAREQIGFRFASTLTLLIFLQFNPVVFAQYYI